MPKKNKINITITTDASYCHVSKSSGYAFILKCDVFTVQRTGNFSSPPSDSTDAEVKCIGNAITSLTNRINRIPGSDLIVINTDSIGAIRAINCQIGVGKHVFAMVNRLRSKLSYPKIEFRHVKAHSGKRDMRSGANRWCDREAKSAMRRMRGEIEKKR